MAGSNTRKASTPSKAPFGANSSSTKKNKSILNFFQKTDSPQGAKSTQLRMSQFVTSSRSPSSARGTPVANGNEGLFLEDKKALARTQQTPVKRDTEDRPRSHTPDDIWGEGDDFMGGNDGRYNENESSVKRRKVSSADTSVQDEQAEDETKPVKSSVPPRKATSGPFIDESDSEDDLDVYQDIEETTLPSDFKADPLISRSSNGDATGDLSADAEQPPLVREATNNDDYDEYENFDDYEGEDEFLGDEFLGDEFREQMPDNEDMDGLPTELCPEDLALIKELQAQDDQSVNMHAEDEPLCPSCMGPLGELNEQQRMIHVNDCLDGKPDTLPLSKPKPVETAPKPPAAVTQATKANAGLTRAERAAVARPAQRDPYSQNKQPNSSAFSKMMAGNAEDTAWANAAAHEVSSRGKQAYQRTCPFYKIMNGFSICVDAFRYGAVEGCDAYFLSHFHSDHYIGLSKSWSHGPIYCSRATGNLVRQQLRVDPKWVVDLDFETTTEVPDTGGVQVTLIQANHCPGSALFVFEKSFGSGPHTRRQRILHCGDFRASPDHVRHPLLCPNPINPVTRQPRQQRLDQCYLDTTYLSPKYAFPSQESVITACAELCVRLNEETGVGLELGKSAGGLMNKFLSSVTGNGPVKEKAQSCGRLLVVIGTYSIGKERICMGIARALGSKIFATPQKQRICSCLEDPELSAMLTSDPKEAQVHMQTLFEIRADTLADYLDSHKPHFSRVVGFRPTGWSYRPPAGRMLENPPVPTVLRGEHWKTPFTVENLTPQRGSTRESSCFGVPYSEHSSFRELTMFCCALRIGKVIPTVNVGSQKSRDNMKIWMERWEGEKKRNGLFPVEDW